MSADNFWLIRERRGIWYVTMEFASNLENIEEPSEDSRDIDFATLHEALDWVKEKDASDGWGATEYGIYHEDSLDDLRIIKEQEAAELTEQINVLIAQIRNS